MKRDLQGQIPAALRTKKTRSSIADFSLVLESPQRLLGNGIAQGSWVLTKRTSYYKPVGQEKRFKQRPDLEREKTAGGPLVRELLESEGWGPTRQAKPGVRKRLQYF